MAPTGSKALAFEYLPIPVSPMGVALLLLVGIVTFLLGPIAAYPEGLWPLGGLCFLPFVVLLAWALANRPSPTRIHAEGIEVSLPLWRRAVGTRRFYPWEEVVNVFPASYEISGAFLSPFASRAGTPVPAGMGLETAAGERLTVKFTPGAIRAFRGETEGYRRAMEAVREVFTARGRPLVSSVKAYTDDEVKAMQAEGREAPPGRGTDPARVPAP